MSFGIDKRHGSHPVVGQDQTWTTYLARNEQLSHERSSNMFLTCHQKYPTLQFRPSPSEIVVMTP